MSSNPNAASRGDQRGRALALRDKMISEISGAAEVIGSYLPKKADQKRFLALANRAVVDNPDIWECSVPSVLRALGAAAASGLPIDGKMSSIIVRKNKDSSAKTAVWDPSYRGMVYLALESGHVTGIDAYAVFENDQFDVELGSDPRILHRPCLRDDRGPVIAAYAIATLKTGGQVREVLGRADLERIRKASPAGDRGPWGTDPDRMSMKSAVRRLLKRLPAADIGSIGTALDHVIEHDDDPGAFLAHSGQPAPDEPADTSDLEARAIEAIAEADSIERVAAVWVGIRAEFQKVKADIPLSLEARYNDRREALAQ